MYALIKRIFQLDHISPGSFSRESYGEIITFDKIEDTFPFVLTCRFYHGNVSLNRKINGNLRTALS